MLGVEMRLCRTILVLSMAAYLATPATAGPDTPVASKDGLTFTLSDLNLYWLRNLGKEMLLDFFQMMVVYQEGLKQNLGPSEAEVRDFIESTMGQDIYQEFLQLYNEPQVRQLVEYTIVGGKYETWLRDKIRREQNITVSESDAHQYYLSNLEQFHIPDGVYISLISVDNQTQANAVIDSLAKGRNFGDLAAEVNMDATMRANRGEIGMYRKGDGLPEPLEDAAFALGQGRYSPVVKGQNYHIVFCHKKYDEISTSFNDVKEQLMLDLVETQIDPFYIEAINELMERELPRFELKADLFRAEDQ